MPDYRQQRRPGGAGGSRRGEPRRWTREGFVPFRLEALTPVFIGSGGDLSPLEYVIRQEGGECALHLVDTASWLQAAQEMDDVRSALTSGDMQRLRRLMDERLDAALYSLARVPLAETLATQLRAHITDPDSLSNAEIQPFPRSPVSSAAYVPGSSLKGAISTALIDSLDQGGKLREAPSYNAEMREMLGSIATHSMQALKVSDVPVPPGSTRIVAAREVASDPDVRLTRKCPCEVLSPAGGARLSIYGRLLLSQTRPGVTGIVLPQDRGVLSLRRIAEICNAFYQKRFRDELARFYRQGALSSVGARLDPHLARVDALDPEKDLLLRVGHYSHVESVTVTANRPKAPKGYGTTRTLAGGVVPFGWVLLSFCPPEEYAEGMAKVEAAIADAQRRREEGRARREEQIRRAVEEQRKRAEAGRKERELAAELERQKREEQAREIARAEEERRRKEREAAEREAALASLSPEERLIAEVSSPQGTKEQSMRLFALLDSLEGDLPVKAASALSDCWQRLGEWNKKQVSKKQWEKVLKVKQVLGA